jgi:NAD(P)-dependent dehydrogenase (short-subunit alcohol dehydrogenase family)
MPIVLITGCSSGFGLLAALEFARRGDHVFASMRNTAKSAALDVAAKSEGLDIDVLQLDVNDESSVQQAVKQVIASAGRIDVLVNNAGIGKQGPLEEFDDDEINAVFETNVFGAFRTMRAVLPVMRAQNAGRIINVSSLAGVIAPPYESVYSASKHALEAASEALYYEVQPWNIRVSLIEPGGYETEIERNMQPPRRHGEGSPYLEREQRFRESLTRLPAAGARGDAHEVARLIVDVAHAENPKLRYLAGQDAELVAGVRKQLDDEAYEQAMRTSLNFWD